MMEKAREQQRIANSSEQHVYASTSLRILFDLLPHKRTGELNISLTFVLAYTPAE